MFDIGFSEMIIMAIIALVVVGPERLPKLARQIGEWMGEVLDALAANRSGDAAVEKRVRDAVTELTGRFPIYPELA